MAPPQAEPTETAAGIRRGRRRVRRRRPVSASAATFLSFLWPGLGNAYARQRARAAFFALPPLLLLIVAAAAIAADPLAFAVSLLVPSFALLVILLIAVHGAWRVAAIFDAWRATRGGTRILTDRHLPLAVLLSVAIVFAHVGAGVFVQSFADAGEQIFQGDRPQGTSDLDDILGGGGGGTGGGGGNGGGGTGSLPGDTNNDGVVDWNDDGWFEDEDEFPPEEDGNGDGLPDDDDDDPLADQPGPPFDPDAVPPPIDPDHLIGAPSAGPPGRLPAEGPINVLFIGIDSGPGRSHALTDTLMVASYFPARDKVTMISIPRDTGRTPLYKGGTYPRRINTFLGYARRNPHLFPEGPVVALMKQIGYILGTNIHFYAATNLEGLPRAVNAVGGVTIKVDKAIHSVKSNYFLDPGTYHFNGAEALRFARVRYGSSDFARARRQQQVIRALAARVRDPAVAVRLPQVIDALTEVVRTNVPREQTPTLLRILERANDASTENIVLRPSYYARRVTGIHFYMIELNIAAVREMSKRVFGSYSRYR